MIKNSVFKKFIEYKKQRDLKEKINKVKPYKLPDIKRIKKDKEEIVYDLISKLLGWSKKVIGKTGSGKTAFVSVFLKFLIKCIHQLAIKLGGIE